MPNSGYLFSERNFQKIDHCDTMPTSGTHNMYSRKRLYNSHIWTVSTSSTTMFFRPISSLLWPSSLFRNVHILANRLTTSIQNTDTFMFLTSPFFSRAVGISEILEGTYYRWLNPRKFLLFSKTCQNTNLSISPNEKMLRIVIWHILWRIEKNFLWLSHLWYQVF